MVRVLWLSKEKKKSSSKKDFKIENLKISTISYQILIYIFPFKIDYITKNKQKWVKYFLTNRTHQYLYRQQLYFHV